MKLFDSLYCSEVWAFGYLVRPVYLQNVSFKDSYFLLMFGLGGFLYYVYRRGNSKLKEKDNQKKKK